MRQLRIMPIENYEKWQLEWCQLGMVSVGNNEKQQLEWCQLGTKSGASQQPSRQLRLVGKSFAE